MLYRYAWTLTCHRREAVRGCCLVEGAMVASPNTAILSGTWISPAARHPETKKKRNITTATKNVNLRARRRGHRSPVTSSNQQSNELGTTLPHLQQREARIYLLCPLFRVSRLRACAAPSRPMACVCYKLNIFPYKPRSVLCLTACLIQLLRTPRVRQYEFHHISNQHAR